MKRQLTKAVILQALTDSCDWNKICTQYELPESFIDFFKSANFANTTLVVMADHLFMAGSEQQQLFSGKRTLFNRFISPKPLELNRNNVTHFDIYPTLLEIAGLKTLTNGQMALGYSGINTIDLIEYQNYRKELEKNGMNYSSVYQSFW